MVWGQLEPTKAHVAYACVGVFSSIFSLVSLFFKERLYIGESTVAGIFGIIVGPSCLDWFNPFKWGNSDVITLEITRIVLCLQIFAVAVELPKKYMLRHWLSVTMLLLPVMTSGWLLIGLFIWILIPGLNFCSSLLVSACITATDPILAQSVVSGKFAQRVPGHLRNLLSAESGCNDGMAFPFIYLSLDLVLHRRHASTVARDWICVTLLYECLFGCILGAIIGYLGRRAIKYAEDKNIIDRESFLAYYIVLAFCCAGFGSILGVDDLLVSFSAGAAFAWDGWFSKKTKESKVSTVIDLLLNYAYFIYFGAIVPWSSFNDPKIGCDVWRLIILALIVILLRRIPAVLILKHWIPDIKSWREALFVGHFGPIGVGAVFAAILSRGELEMYLEHTGEPLPLGEYPPRSTEHWQLISCIWPIVCFLIVTSIIVHGSSVAMITLGKHLNTITLSRSFSTATTNGGKSSWIQRLPSLEGVGRSFSLQRVDTGYSSSNEERGSKSEVVSRTSTVETSGVPFRHAGGMRKRPQGVQTASEAAAEENSKRRKARRRKRRNKLLNSARDLFRPKSSPYKVGDLEENGFADDETGGGGMHELNNLGRERLQREREARATTFALGSTRRYRPEYVVDEEEEEEAKGGATTGTVVAVDGSDLSKKQLPRVYVQTVNEEEEEEEEEEEQTSELDENSSDTGATTSSTASVITSDRSVRNEGGVPSDVYRLKSPVVEELNNYPFAESEFEEEEGEGEENNDKFVQPDNSTYDLEKQLPQRPLKRRFKEQYSDNKGKSKRRELTNEDNARESHGRGRYDDDTHGKVAYIDGDQLLVENDLGEIVSIANFGRQPQDEEAQARLSSGVNNTGNQIIAEHKEENGIHKTESHTTEPSLEAVKRVVSPKILSKVQSLVSSVVSITPGFTSNEPNEHIHKQHKKPDTYQSEKYHAYRLGNVLIIENDEGDIIRRYRINKHPETSTSTSSKQIGEPNQREKKGHGTEGAIQRALGMFGLRGGPATITNVENNDNEAVPMTEACEVEASTSGSGSGSNLAAKEGEYTSEDYGLDDLANDRVEDTEDSYEEETEVERMRRLRALGRADDHRLVGKEKEEKIENKDSNLTSRDDPASSDMSDGGVVVAGDNAKSVGGKLRDSIKRRFW